MDQLMEMMGGGVYIRGEQQGNGVAPSLPLAHLGNLATGDCTVLAYGDRIARLDDILKGEDPLLRAERRRVIAIIGHEPSDEEKAELLEKMRGQSVENFITRWGKIVLILSANVVPYDPMRAIPIVKPFDLIQNPIILENLQARYRAFRGYKIPALKTHIAHYFCLREGARCYAQEQQISRAPRDHQVNEDYERHIWKMIVIYAPAVLLVKLQN